MQFTVAIREVSFFGASINKRVVIQAQLAYSGTTTSLSDSQRVFAPQTRESVVLGDAAWSHRVTIGEARRRAAELTLTVDLVLESNHHTIERLEHTWPATRHFESVRIEGRAFSVELTTTVRGAVARDVRYVRRAGATGAPPVVMTAGRTLVHAVIDPVVPHPARGDRVEPGFASGPGLLGYLPGIVRPPSALNPAVIPAVPNGGAPSARWLRSWAAHMKITTLLTRGAFSADDLTWSFEALDGSPTLSFHGGARGTEVTAWGRGRGEVRLWVTHRSTRVAQVRALVREPALIRTRLVILVPRVAPGTTLEEGVRTAIEGVTLDRFNRQLNVANRYLRQVAIRLRRATLSRVAVPAERVAHTSTSSLRAHAHDHGSAGVITFVIIHSIAPNDPNSDLLGLAAGIPRAGVTSFGSSRNPESDNVYSDSPRASVAETGTPSTSLIVPTGIPPDSAARPQIMQFFLRGGHDQAVIYLTLEGTGGATGLTGRTIAHEVGHVFNLCHRGQDGLPAQGTQNLMLSSMPEMANDLDIAQAKVMWQSPLITS